MAETVVIAGAARTPIGDFMGELAPLSAPQLGTAAIQAALAQAGLPPEQIQAVNMGCVLSAGLGQAPARQAALAAGLDKATHCLTLNKMCGSGLQAVILAHDAIVAGTYQRVIAGGMESMSNAPYLLEKARAGYRMGHAEMFDHMLYDGLEDVYTRQAMGVYAEATAEKYGFSREQQDAFALTSLQRARQATAAGLFAAELTPITVPGRKTSLVVENDQHPRVVNADKIPQLRPAFVQNGTVTAANASSIADGAAALVLLCADEAERQGLTPLTRIVGHASHSQAPEWFTTAPVAAIESLLRRIGWTVDQVDLFEVNEAFAAVAMAAMTDLSIPYDKLNVNGGACALGHPIGASGARILVSLQAALLSQGLQRGVAALCIGGGEAVAVAVERL